MRTVIHLLKEATEKYPKEVYLGEKVRNEWKKRTYPQVDKESDHVAMALLSLGFEKNDKIAILSEGRADWVISEYGILKAGCIAVPLSIKLMPEEILFRLNHSESKAIFVSKNTIEKIDPIVSKIECKGFKIIVYDDDFLGVTKLQNMGVSNELIKYSELYEKGEHEYVKDREKLAKVIESIDEQDVVTISYTSGTTGNPKGIMLTHLNYYSNSRDAWEYFKLEQKLKTLIILPLDHSFAHTVGIYISLVCALSIYFVDGSGGPTATLKNIPVNLKEVQPDMLLTVPALTGNFIKKISDGINAKGGFVKGLFWGGLRAGMRMQQDGFRKAGFFTCLFNYIPYAIANAIVFKKVRGIFGGRLQFCVGGGALLDIKQQHFYYALGIPIYQGYGLTEATPIISANCSHTHKMGTSGRVINHVDCRIMDSEGRVMPKGQKGEIAIQGNNVMKGYYKNPDATKEVIRGNWLYTGDMGYFDNDDFLMVVGREKALLISEDGEKYSPEAIEEAIANCSDLVNQCLVYNDHKKYTTAIITIDEARIKNLKQSGKTTDDILEEIKTSFYQFRESREYAGQFPAKWIPSSFRIAPEAFSEQNKMINSTLKMIRYKIVESYPQLIEDMYSGEEKTTVLCNHNRDVIAKL